MKPVLLNAGCILWTPHDGSAPWEEPVTMCAHCQRVLVYRKGSGGSLATCPNCRTREGTASIICGDCVRLKRACDYRYMIENMEAGRPDDWRPVYVLVSGVPRG